MSHEGPSTEPAESRFRSTLVRVLIVQVVALTVLALIQMLYNA